MVPRCPAPRLAFDSHHLIRGTSREGRVIVRAKAKALGGVDADPIAVSSRQRQGEPIGHFRPRLCWPLGSLGTPGVS